MKISAHSLMLTLMLFCCEARAEVLVLIHGYHSGASAWSTSGIIEQLDNAGWTYSGNYAARPGGLTFTPGKKKANKNSLYTVDLPSEAPVLLQSNLLQIIITQLDEKYVDESMVLVGHSAGGIIARTVLVNGFAAKTRALITIASPHVGTSRAEQAIDATRESGPIGMVKNLFGGENYNTLKRSRGLLFDLVRPNPGSLLYWLNNQPHPDIQYASVMRMQSINIAGDQLVPGYSQDMNNVSALHGKSAVMKTPHGHSLAPQDGQTILQILDHLE